MKLTAALLLHPGAYMETKSEKMCVCVCICLFIHGDKKRDNVCECVYVYMETKSEIMCVIVCICLFIHGDKK